MPGRIPVSSNILRRRHMMNFTEKKDIIPSTGRTVRKMTTRRYFLRKKKSNTGLLIFLLIIASTLFMYNFAGPGRDQGQEGNESTSYKHPTALTGDDPGKPKSNGTDYSALLSKDEEIIQHARMQANNAVSNLEFSKALDLVDEAHKQVSPYSKKDATALKTTVEAAVEKKYREFESEIEWPLIESKYTEALGIVNSYKLMFHDTPRQSDVELYIISIGNSIKVSAREAAANVKPVVIEQLPVEKKLRFDPVKYNKLFETAATRIVATGGMVKKGKANVKLSVDGYIVTEEEGVEKKTYKLVELPPLYAYYFLRYNKDDNLKLLLAEFLIESGETICGQQFLHELAKNLSGVKEKIFSIIAKFRGLAEVPPEGFIYSARDLKWLTKSEFEYSKFAEGVESAVLKLKQDISFTERKKFVDQIVSDFESNRLNEVDSQSVLETFSEILRARVKAIKNHKNSKTPLSLEKAAKSKEELHKLAKEALEHINNTKDYSKTSPKLAEMQKKIDELVAKMKEIWNGEINLSKDKKKDSYVEELSMYVSVCNRWIPQNFDEVVTLRDELDFASKQEHAKFIREFPLDPKEEELITYNKQVNEYNEKLFNKFDSSLDELT
ncbi:MAG: hypothetical protein HY606_13600, partial [Planctomycetes bacterium]|nr:hypothetical protein [Planctomycetota bacterium]